MQVIIMCLHFPKELAMTNVLGDRIDVGDLKFNWYFAASQPRGPPPPPRSLRRLARLLYARA